MFCGYKVVEVVIMRKISKYIIRISSSVNLYVLNEGCINILCKNIPYQNIACANIMCPNTICY